MTEAEYNKMLEKIFDEILGTIYDLDGITEKDIEKVEEIAKRQMICELSGIEDEKL